MMKRLMSCFVCLAVLSGCSDFSSSLVRNDDGSLQPTEIWLAELTSQYVYAPGEEEFLDAESTDPGIARVGAVDGDRLIVEAGAPGTTTLEFRTDESMGNERATVEVRRPEEVSYYAPSENDWVATTGQFEIGYDLFAEDEKLEGAGFKVIEQAPGLEIRERPLELEDVGLLKGTYHRKLRVLEGVAGSYTLETTIGDDISLRRIEVDDVDYMEAGAGFSEAEVGDSSTVSATGYYDDTRVIGFNDFKARTRTRRICTVDEQDRDDDFTAWIQFKRPGECKILVKHRQLDWEQIVTFRVR